MKCSGQVDNSLGRRRCGWAVQGYHLVRFHSRSNRGVGEADHSELYFAAGEARGALDEYERLRRVIPEHRAERHDGSLLLAFEDDSDRKSTRLNSSHLVISYAVFCFKKKILIDFENAFQLAIEHLGVDVRQVQVP